ncbi:MAG: response regulator [Bdellovibrio sp.]|nr:response regulator [Bdellovibrio sp.]
MIHGLKKEQYTALVVDDEQKICDLICLFLSATGRFKTLVAAHNAVQAVQKLQNQTFDLLIIDHKMPGKTGIDLIGTLSKTPKNRMMKFILISGCLTKEDVIVALNEGGRHILVKPFGRAQLLNKVGEVLKDEFVCQK